MFWDDIKLVTEQIEKYGLRSPMLDLSGNDRPSIQDFEVTSDSKILRARTANLTSRPFDHITHDYTSISCKAGRPNIEEILSKPARSIGTAVCIDALQRIDNPFELFSALSTTMMDDSLLIISSLFSHPHDTAKQDLWRFSPECLKSIANKFGFTMDPITTT